MGAAAWSGQRWGWGLAGALIISVAVFSQTLTASFVSDDYEMLSVARRPDALSHILTTPIGGQVYRPVVFLSFLLEYRLVGARPFSFHFTNTLLHGLNGFLLGLLTWRFTRRRLLAAFSAVFFLVYPAHHEAVSWISGRFDVLATTLILMSALFFEGALQRKPGRLVVCVATAALAFLSKEIAFVLPVYFLVRALLDRRYRSWPLLARPLGSILAAFLLVLALRGFIVGDFIGGYQTFGQSITRAMTLADIRTFVFSPLWLLTRSANVIFLAASLPTLANIAQGPWLTIWFTLLVVWWLITNRWQALRQLFILLGLTYLLLLPALPLLATVSRSLESTRLWYLPSAPLMVLLASAVTALKLAPTRWLAVTGSLMLFTLLQAVNAHPWRIAGVEAAAITSAVTAYAVVHDPAAYAVFRRIPDNRYGAYVFRRGLGEYLDGFFPGRFPKRAQIGRTYKPQFTDCPSVESELPRMIVLDWNRRQATFTVRTDIRDRFLAQINEKSHNASAQIWSNSVSLPEHADAWQPSGVELATGPTVVSGPGGGALVTTVPSIAPRDIATLTLTVTTQARRTAVPISLYWRGEDEPFDEYERHLLFPVSATGKSSTVTIPLCGYLPWLLSEPLTKIRLQFSRDVTNLTIHDLRFNTL